MFGADFSVFLSVIRCRRILLLCTSLAKPTNATGVPIHITAIDPNGNFQDIGIVNSDASGNYATMWTPPVPGVYKITATFEGSKSYWSSTAQTAVVVGPAKSPAVLK
jgi:hypothetical protein